MRCAFVQFLRLFIALLLLLIATCNVLPSDSEHFMAHGADYVGSWGPKKRSHNARYDGIDPWHDMGHSMMCHSITWHDMTWDDMTWHRMTWHDMTWYDIVWHDIARHNIMCFTMILTRWIAALHRYFAVVVLRNCEQGDTIHLSKKSDHYFFFLYPIAFFSSFISRSFGLTTLTRNLFKLTIFWY